MEIKEWKSEDMAYAAFPAEMVEEEAEEQVVVDYTGDAIEIGFNVSYLQDICNVLDSENLKITLTDTNGSALLEEAAENDSVYVVMPMRL